MKTTIAVAYGVLLIWHTLAEAGQPADQAAEKTSQAVLQALQARPRVAVSVTQQNPVVTGALDIHVELTNLSDNDFNIRQIELELPGEIEAARRGQPDPDRARDPQTPVMNPGHAMLVTFKVPAQEVGYFRPLVNRALLTFLPGDYPLRVVVTYSVPPQNETNVSETAMVRLEPPLMSLLWGGALGAILLAAFVTTYRLVRQRPSRKPAGAALEAVLLTAAGIVCALIALILLRRLQGVELPVNITVTDFYGGVVIGLFSFKIGDWLYTQLFGDSEHEPANISQTTTIKR